MQCPRCQVENREGARFCRDCGETLGVVCPGCGTKVEAGSKFCDSCGAPLAIAPASQSIAPRFISPDSYTPQHLANKILTSKSALEGERKQVTVLFADLKGSMELLADRDPEEARKLLDPVLEHMMEAVHRYEGTVNQVMGDGIMALFGAPVAHEDHAVRACYAALRMQESVKRYAEGIFRTYGIPVRIRVGLNSGDVVVRSIGSDLHMDYTAVGQTTHLAARMEQMADPGAILLTSDTLQLAESFVHVQSLGRVAVKGLTTPAEIFALTGASPVRSRLQAAAAKGLTTFVGRDAEMDTLFTALEQAKAGKGQLVAVVGEPGVGKSRLFWEFAHSQRTHECLVLEAASVSYSKATAYFPVIELLKGYFQIEPRDETRKIREKVTGKLFSLDRALESCLAPLLWLLDVPAEDADWERLDPPQRRQRLLEGLRRLILRESQVQLLVLVFEDLHWIDGETQALLDHLVESLPTARLLLLVNYRPEYPHGWGNKTYYRQLRIDPLSPGSAERLLGALLGHDPSVVALRPILIARTEGNPFFLEETVQSLVEIGALAGGRGAYRLVKPPQALNIPATAQSVLAARIDRLAPDDKRLLQTASVIGKDVPYPLLQAIAEMDETALRAGLARLRASEFLYEARLFPDLEYTFKHALTQQVAYQSILQDRRRALHAQLVQSMEGLDARRIEDHIERLAEHAQRGEVWEKAVVYIPQAGAKAAARGASKEAAVYFEQGLAALAQLPESSARAARAIDLRIELRNTLLVHDQVGPALDCILLAEATARSLGDQHRLARVLAHKTHSLWLMGRHREAVAVGREARTLAKAVGDFSLVVAATQYLGQVHRTIGEYSVAISLLRENVAALHGALAADRFGMHALPAVLARGFLADCLSLVGEFAEAVALGREGVQIAEAVGHTFSIVASHALCGGVYVRKGDLDKGIPILERGFALCQASDIRQWFTTIAANLSLAYSLVGRATAASATLDVAREVIPTWRSATLGAELSQALLLADRVQDAMVLANRFADDARAAEQPVVGAWVPRVVAELALRHNATALGDAIAHYHTALDQGTLFGLRPHIAHCHLALARLYGRTGERGCAHEHITTATSMYSEMDMPFWLEKAEEEARGLA